MAFEYRQFQSEESKHFLTLFSKYKNLVLGLILLAILGTIGGVFVYNNYLKPKPTNEEIINSLGGANDQKPALVSGPADPKKGRKYQFSPINWMNAQAIDKLDIRVGGLKTEVTKEADIFSFFNSTTNQDEIVVTSEGYETYRSRLSELPAKLFLFPKGGKLIFTADEGGESKLYSVSPNGDGRKALTSGYNVSKAILKDDGIIYFKATKSGQNVEQLFSITPDGANLDQISFLKGDYEDDDFKYSESGYLESKKKIVVINNKETNPKNNSQLWLGDVLNKSQVTIRNRSYPNNAIEPVSQALISPDGSNLSYVLTRTLEGEFEEIRLISTNGEGEDVQTLFSSKSKDSKVKILGYSSNGGILAYSKEEAGAKTVIFYDTGNKKVLKEVGLRLHIDKITFSKDGNVAYFVQNIDGKRDLWHLNLQFEELKTLTDTGEVDNYFFDFQNNFTYYSSKGEIYLLRQNNKPFKTPIMSNMRMWSNLE